MKNVHILMLPTLIAMLTVSCNRDSEEMAIQGILESSPYLAEGAVQNYDDSTNVPSPFATMQPFLDTISYVRWVRWIERPIIRHYEITVNGDSADVTIYAYLTGSPPGYGFFVNNDPFGPVYERIISDSLVRRVKLWKNEAEQWRIASLTAADIHTANNQNPVAITQVRAVVSSRNYEFVITDPSAYYERSELPIFFPNDTVEVTVTCSAFADSTWAFLHHGTGHRPGVGYHIRQPFLRDGVNTFTRTWVIAHDSIIVTPAVRHSAVDVLGWQTLFGNEEALYYARAWCLPYIVLLPGEEIPGDD
jgi:hypothetical protein